MCVAFPGQVVSFAPDGSVVRTEGTLRKASTLLHPEVRAGEWVIVALGTIVERLNDRDAAEIRQALLDAAAASTAAAERVDAGP